MSKIKCTFCGKESETELSMLGDQEMLGVDWACHCHNDDRPSLTLEPEKYLYIGCIPVSACPNHPVDQSRCVKITCPHCNKLMWLSEKKRKMINRNPDEIEAYCLDCLTISAMGQDLKPELIDIDKVT